MRVNAGIFYFWISNMMGESLQRHDGRALSEWSNDDMAASIVDLQRCLRGDYFAIITT